MALASLIAEWTGLALGPWLCRAGLTGRDWHSLCAGDRLRRMVSVNGDIMLRSVLLQGSFTTFVFLGAGFGTVTLAANQVLMQLLEVTAYGLDGFAFAAEALVGRAIGARSAALGGDFQPIGRGRGAGGALAGRWRWCSGWPGRC